VEAEQMSEIDLSDFSYEEWVAFFFRRDVDPSGDLWDDYEFAFEPRQPDRLISHLTCLCRHFSTLPTQYTWGQIDQAVWAILMRPAQMADMLMRSDVPLNSRTDCIHAMYHVYADVITTLDPAIPMENCFDMWWDIVAKAFCSGEGHYDDSPFRPDDADARRMHDAILSTVVQILQLGEVRCEHAALHGLGHLQHPDGAKIVQEYIDKHSEDLTPDGLAWLIECRDGTVM
jgi:hypothetical protein